MMSEETIRLRQYEGAMNCVIGVLLIAIPVWALAYLFDLHIYLGMMFTLPQSVGGFLGLVLGLAFLLFPATKRAPNNKVPWYDVILALLGLAVGIYLVLYHPDIQQRHYVVTRFELFLGATAILLILEASRRSTGWCLPIMGFCFIFYAFYTNIFPGILQGKGYSFDRVVPYLYFMESGILGDAMHMAATIVIAYILFGQALLDSGCGKILSELCLSLVGRFRGGPAKVAVIASALFGTMSGSPGANVAVTGTFTIPMMKRLGFSKEFAGAVEAATSTGGQIMPPIMGAGAFIMSEVTGVPYFKIIQAAAIPALLYYLGLFFVVHFISVRQGMVAIPKADRPSVWSILRNGYYFSPFIMIIIFLAYGYSPSKSAFYVILIILGLSFLDRRTWLTPKKILDTLFQSAMNAAIIATALAASGMIVGILTRTGAALAFGGVLLSASFNNLVLAMILVFLVVSVLGTGIPTTPSYIIAVTVGASALGNFGVALLAAHLFVFYYAVLSDLTPPDAITAFAAANLAGSEMMSTGVEAFKLGIAGFLVPFAFVFQPALLLQGTFLEIIRGTALAGLGVVCLAAFLIGYVWAPLSWLHRILFAVAAGLLVFPTIGMEILGIGLALGLFIWARLKV